MDHTDGALPAPRSRRDVLAGALTVGLLTAGCAGGTPSGGAPPADTPTGTGPTGTAPTGPAGGSGATGTVLGTAADVPVGGGAVYQALEVVVTQPAAGDFRGLSAICTHTACIVNEIADGEIVCPCHGSRYRLDGTVARGPAPRPLQSRPVRVENGQIVLL